MKQVFDYIVNGGDELALTQAQLEHMGGALERELDENKRLQADNERLRGALQGAEDEIETLRTENETVRRHLKTILQACDKPSCGWYLIFETTIDEARAAINIHKSGETCSE